MKTVLSVCTLLLLAGCVTPQQKAETEALAELHKAENKVTSAKVNLTLATSDSVRASGMVNKTTKALKEANIKRDEAKEKLKEILDIE